MKGTVTETSKEAYNSLSKAQITEMQKLIIFALKNMPDGGNSHQIAAVLKKPEDKVRKRLSELASLDLIFKPGHTSLTPSGRNAFIWKIKGQDNAAKEQIRERIMTGKPVHEYAKAIKSIGQASLF
jgi:hypothetical protein